MPSQENYKMPEPYCVCLWAPAQGMEWSPALVTKVSRNTVSVVVFTIDARMGVPKDGVRYLNDPGVQHISPDEGGIWDFSPEQKILRDLMGIKDDDVSPSRRRKAEVA